LDWSAAAAVPNPATTNAATAMSRALRHGLVLERPPSRLRRRRVVVAVISFSSAVVDRLHFRDTDGDSGRLVERTQGSSVRAVRPCHRPGDGGLHCECILGLAAALAGRRVLVGVGAGL